MIVKYIFRGEEIPADGIVVRLMYNPAGKFFENWDYKGGCRHYKDGIGGFNNGAIRNVESGGMVCMDSSG
jgi:hypothetical protein